MAEEVYPINIWINEDRYKKLERSAVAGMVKDVLAGMKVIQVPTTAEQKDEMLKRFPMAKFDTATTRTIELLPREVKDKIFDLVAEKGSVNVIDDFLRSLR
jgi:hypothetical protein